MESNTKSTVVIVGAGIAGPILGLHIQRNPKLLARFLPILVDRDPCPPPPSSNADSGAAVVLSGNGIYPIHKLGLKDDFNAISQEVNKVEIWRSPDSKSGSTTVKEATWYNCLQSPAYDPDVDTSLRSVERGRLQSLLVHSFMAAGGEVRWSTKVSTVITNTDNSSTAPVAAVLDSGDQIPAHLIVGADGNWSRIRRALLPTSWRPDFYHNSAIFGIARLPPSHVVGESDKAHAMMATAGMAATWPLPDGRVMFDMHTSEAKAPEYTPATMLDIDGVPMNSGGFTEASSRALLDRYRNTWHPVYGSFGAIIDSAERMGRVGLYQKVYSEAEIVGFLGHVVLVGDAARVMVPASGQGACMAIEDATVLADSLLNHLKDVPKALTEYAEKRVPRNRKVAWESWMKLVFGMGDRWWTGWGWIRDWLTKIFKMDTDNRELHKQGKTVNLGYLFNHKVDVEDRKLSPEPEAAVLATGSSPPR